MSWNSREWSKEVEGRQTACKRHQESFPPFLEKKEDSKKKGIDDKDTRMTLPCTTKETWHDKRFRGRRSETGVQRQSFSGSLSVAVVQWKIQFLSVESSSVCCCLSLLTWLRVSLFSVFAKGIQNKKTKKHWRVKHWHVDLKSSKFKCRKCLLSPKENKENRRKRQTIRVFNVQFNVLLLNHALFQDSCQSLASSREYWVTVVFLLLEPVQSSSQSMEDQN